MFNSVLSDEWRLNHRTFSDLGTNPTSENEPSDLCRYYFDFTQPTNSSETYLKEEPEELRLTYLTDLDLVSIHRIIREKIIMILRRLLSNDERLKIINSLINSNTIPPIEVKFLNKEIADIQEYKSRFLCRNLWESYKLSVVPILNKYVLYISNEYKGQSIAGNSISIDEFKIQEKIKCIDNYISNVNKLNILKIKAVRNFISKAVCPSCFIEMSFDNSSEEIGRYSCNCGFTEDTVKHISEYSDNTKNIQRVNTLNTNNKTIQLWKDRWFCRSGENYPKDEMFKKFDEFCIKNNLPNRFTIKGTNYQPNMQTIIFLLQNNDYSQYYILKNQIRHDYYGWNPPQITEVQDSLISQLYIDFQNMYQSTKERKTSINIEILGCVLLILAGVHVDVNDFKIPANQDTILYSHNLIKKTFKELGYKDEEIPNVLEFTTQI